MTAEEVKVKSLRSMIGFRRPENTWNYSYWILENTWNDLSPHNDDDDVEDDVDDDVEDDYDDDRE